MSEKKTAEKKMDFEQALQRLEQIVEDMESGNAKLDESLALFEEGVQLVKFCREALDKAEKKVMMIQTDKNGAKSETEFTPKNED
ncbi:MAG: exodeoxyribonuclease VII small subunit [Clostridiales bacterium]|nr:exodeoxyribonuclease VII small subunit [Clostridiales bacterium]